MTISTIRQMAMLAVPAFSFFALATPASAELLSVEGFMDTHVGACISYQGESIGVQCFYADGTMDYDDESYGKDTGTWSISGANICQEWSADPGVSCVPFTHDGDGNYSDGAYTWTIN